MVRLNLTEAAKAANVSRSTLYRHIKEGRISRTFNHDSEPEIDTSELMRVYGPLEQRYNTKEHTIVQTETSSKTQELEHEIEILRLKLAHKKELQYQAEKEKSQWQEQAEKLTLMLTDQRNNTNKKEQSVSFKKFMAKLARTNNE